jgi:uncharacterized MAPEG superfamily protein
MMTTDLWCLVANAVWGLGLITVEITGKTKIAGVSWNKGNRDDAPQFPSWIKRTSNALANHKENFSLFMVAVLVVHLAGKADHVSALGALGYVVARALHAMLYIGGVTGLRTVAWLAGLASVLVVLSRLFV